MKNTTILHEVSPEQITNLFEELKNQIKVLNEKFEPKQPTKCDLSSLWLWTKKGKLISYGIGNRIYYKRSEIESAIICLNKKKGANND